MFTSKRPCSGAHSSGVRLRANSRARQLRGFCFPGSSQQISLKRAEVLLCSWPGFQLFSPSDVQLALLFLPLRNCRVPACKTARLRSPLATFAPRKSVSLKPATRSDLDAAISSLLSPVSRPCSLAVGEGSKNSPKQEDNHESRASKTNRQQSH